MLRQLVQETSWDVIELGFKPRHSGSIACDLNHFAFAASHCLFENSQERGQVGEKRAYTELPEPHLYGANAVCTLCLQPLLNILDSSHQQIQ